MKIKNPIIPSAALASIVMVTACTQSPPATAPATKPETPAQQVQTGGKDPIIGARNCFWLRGPFSGDPYINVAYPDAATFYWGAVFTMPPGAKLTLEGKFPHARYMSLISYDEAGRPQESVADYLLKPNQGSINPFLPDADRTNPNRDYTLEIVDAKPDLTKKTGMNLVGEIREKLNTPKYGPGQQVILYRIYANDKGQDETGGVGLPVPVLTMPDGKVLKGAETCQAMRTRQALQLDPAALAVPMDKYYDLLAQAAKIGPLHPATNPPTWYQQLDREALYSIYTGQPISEEAQKSVGGFYPNLDNQYIRTILNRKLGKVFMLRGKAPTTPKTLNGNPKFAVGELRYWSFCSNQGFANTRVNDCVYDEQIPVGPDGYYTIAVSRKADRPRNAIPQCGIAWLPMADDGDGAVDENVTVLQLRHMLGTQNFPFSIQAVSKPGNEAKDMGEYFPRGRYMTPSGFETAFPCQIEVR